MKKILNTISKHLGIVLAVFVVISIGIGVLLFTTNPKIKFMRLVNKEYKSFVSVLDQAKASELSTLSKDNTVTSNGSVAFDLTLDSETFGTSLDSLVSVINGLNVNYQYGSDPKNNNTYVKLNSDINAKDFIDMELYQKGDKQYIYLKDIYDKYIESNSTNLVNTQSDKTGDTIYLVNKIKTSLIASLKTSDFTTETKTIDVNGISMVTDKISLKLNDKRMKEIVKVVLTDLKNDDKAISIINSLSGSETNTKDSLNEAINSIDEKTLLEKDVTFDIYVKDDAIVKVDVFEGTAKTMEYISYVDFNPIKELVVYSANQEFIRAKFEQKSVNDISYEISLGKDVVFANGTIAKSLDENVSTKTWNLNLSFNLVLSYENSVLGSIKVDTKATTKVGEKVDIPSTFDAVNENDLTDQEKEDISNKITTKIFDALPASLPTANPTGETNTQTY